MEGRTAHILAAVIISLIGCIASYQIPDLRKDSAAIFGTIGGFVTLYGVVFAIIEVVRTRSAAVMAASEVRKASAVIRSLYDVRSLSECQSCIEHALAGLDTDGIVSSSSLSRIVKLYIAELPLEYADEESSVRRNVNMLQSYTTMPRAAKTKKTGPLQSALVGMMADLSVSASGKISKEA